MAFNSLRRLICDLRQQGGATTDPMLADTLLDRALSALGGPVIKLGPSTPKGAEVTVSVDRTGAVELTNTASGAVVGFVPSVPVPGSMAEFLPADVLTPQDVAAIEQGRDLGDETGPLKYIP